MSFADAGTMFGMTPASVELMVLELHEREELARQRALENGWPDEHDASDNEDDDGEGGTRHDREPVAA
jgi:hypothetical protein